MKTNKEIREYLSQYPDELPVAIAKSYNGNISLFYDLKIKGMQSEDMKVLIITNPDIDTEYETLLNGADIDEEEIYG